jgi:hypothetical protein
VPLGRGRQWGKMPDFLSASSPAARGADRGGGKRGRELGERGARAGIGTERKRKNQTLRVSQGRNRPARVGSRDRLGRKSGREVFHISVVPLGF